MGGRKFYYGDIGEVLEHHNGVHQGHRVRIVGTKIRISKDTGKHALIYAVNCECGKALSIKSIHMAYIPNPDPFPTLQEACYRRFLEETRIPGIADLNKRLAKLKPQWQDCLRRYYGLNSEGKRETLQPIGDSYGVTRENIRQMIARSMKAMRRVDNAVTG